MTMGNGSFASSLSRTPCENGTTSSWSPWMMRTGLSILAILLSFTKMSIMDGDQRSSCVRIADRSGEIRITPARSLLRMAISHVAPVPSERPMTTTRSCGTPRVSRMYSRAVVTFS
eukprot:Amastigsp_a340080_15.p2 type:complete len:116 gc:universal Amastigsp_a340080_15:699-352(-)